MQPGLFFVTIFKSLNKKIDLSTYPIHEFFKKAGVELYSEDANTVIDKHGTDQTVIFQDPPHIASCDHFYSADTGENIENIHEYLHHYKFIDFDSKIIICHENNW